MLIAVIILNDKCSDYYDKYTLHHFVFSVSRYDQMLGYGGGLVAPFSLGDSQFM
jgi:hypothetical protein